VKRFSWNTLQLFFLRNEFMPTKRMLVGGVDLQTRTPGLLRPPTGSWACSVPETWRLEGRRFESGAGWQLKLSLSKNLIQKQVFIRLQTCFPIFYASQIWFSLVSNFTNLRILCMNLLDQLEGNRLPRLGSEPEILLFIFTHLSTTAPKKLKISLWKMTQM
jgi:hypothetical protein